MSVQTKPNHLENYQTAMQAPSVESKSNIDLVAKELKYQKSKNQIEYLSFKQIWDNFQSEAKSGLSKTAQFMQKYRRNFGIGLSGLLLTVAPNFISVNPANAEVQTKSPVTIENVLQNINN
jgi:hypothetical protein